MLNLIKKYISNIKKDDINNFALKNNIYLSNKELDTINYILQNEVENLINDSDKVFTNYKNSFTVENYNKISTIFNEYKKRYKKYL